MQVWFCTYSSFIYHLFLIMPDPFHILAICGSTRQVSANLNLLHAIQNLYKNKLHISIYPNIAALPHFNPDLDNDNVPLIVRDFRTRISEADGILICTPEYAMGVPGSLKNAIDWTVSSTVFSGKPTALITAGLSGEKGHKALMETLNIIEADTPQNSQLIIQFAKTKIKENTIVDEQTEKEVTAVMNSLLHIISERESKQA